MNTKTEKGYLNLSETIRELKSSICDLLAMMHGDGGHYTEKHGLIKSIQDAEALLHTKWVVDTETQSLRDRVKELECEAIKFAKWLRVDSYAITNPKACYDGKNYNHTFQSYEQLYQLFKDDKGIIKRNEIL